MGGVGTMDMTLDGARTMRAIAGAAIVSRANAADEQQVALRLCALRRLAEIEAERLARPPMPVPKKAAPAKRRGRAKSEAAAPTPAENNRAAWAARHPGAAKSERALRKERAELSRWKHKNEGTPETHEHASRRNQGALARLYESGAIDREQLAAAVEIAEVAARIGADVAVRTASLETRIDAGRRGDGSFYEKLGQVRREVAYTRWRSEVRGPIAAVLEMIVGEGGEPVGFTVVAKRYRMHNRRAKALLIAALDLWPRILGHVRKEIDPAALAAAQAGIL